MAPIKQLDAISGEIISSNCWTPNAYLVAGLDNNGD